MIEPTAKRESFYNVIYKVKYGRGFGPSGRRGTPPYFMLLHEWLAQMSWVRIAWQTSEALKNELRQDGL